MISLLTNGKSALHRNEHRGSKENQDRFMSWKIREFHSQCDEVGAYANYNYINLAKMCNKFRKERCTHNTQWQRAKQTAESEMFTFAIYSQRSILWLCVPLWRLSHNSGESRRKMNLECWVDFSPATSPMVWSPAAVPPDGFACGKPVWDHILTVTVWAVSDSSDRASRVIRSQVGSLRTHLRSDHSDHIP